MSSQNVDLATDLLTSHVRSLLHLSGKFSCDFCVLNRSMCISLWRTTFVCNIPMYSSRLLNPIFFAYNFFANHKILYQQIILPTIEVFYLCRAGGPLNAVTDRRLPGPRLTNPPPASPSHHVQSCQVQTQMHTQKQTQHQGPSVFAFVMDHLLMG